MKQKNKAEIFILSAGVCGSFLAIFTALAQKYLPSLWALALSVFFSIFFFLFILIYKKKLREMLITKAWPDIFAGSIIIGILLYVLFFFGLKYTTAGNLALVSRMEIVFSYIFFHIIHKEEITKKHFYGITLMFLATLTLFSPSFGGFNKGDILVLLGVFLAPLGNFYQKRARSLVSSETIMLFRSIITFFGVMIVIFLLNQKVEIWQVKNALPFLILNGIIVFGIEKVLWLEGIHKMSVAKANGLTAFSPLLTILLGVWLLGQPILPKQLFAFLPMTVGLWLLTRKQ